MSANGQQNVFQMGNQNKQNWLPIGQISNKVSVEHWVLIFDKTKPLF